MTSRAPHPSLPPAILFAYLGFIVYGSLVPLDFTPQSLSAAWQKFQQIRMLQLGVESRADWIANGILYFPAGFLAAEWLSGLLPPRARILALLLALAGCSALAIGVEFTQLFFPPRTVSQNDILAECLGSLAGITLAPFMDHWLRQLVAYRPASRETGITLLLAAYLVAYLAFSLFPYDLLLSGAELVAKFNSDQWGIFLAGGKADSRFAIRLARIGLEVAAAIPFGIFLIRRAKGGAPSPASVLLPGALFGLGIEVTQFFIYTGSSEGLSVITRAFGSYAGALLWLRGKHIDAAQIATLARRASLVLAPLYLIGLAAVSGWFSQHWQSSGAAMASFNATRLMPFYYHYYTSEAIALSSLVSNAALYAPVGIVAWAWNRPGCAAAALAALLALIIETSHLFFATTHADPTNLLIAATAAWAATAFAGLVFNPNATLDRVGKPVTVRGELVEPHLPCHDWPSTGSGRTVSWESRCRNGLLDSEPEKNLAADPPPSQAIATLRPTLAARHLATLLCAGGFSAYWLAHFPLQALALAIGLAACAVATWLRPIVMVALIPAALPILDLAPWSGRFFFDEFDILLLVTLAIGYVRVGPAAPGTPGNKLLNMALGLLALSFAISSVRALIPLPSLDANSFASYFSPFNALRISKGLLWAILFIGLVRRIDPAGKQSFRWFAGGITLGLAVTAAIVIREKELFGGLLDFSTEYRATGPFSAIHTGGAYIEAYLAAAVPFLIFLTVRTQSWFQRLAGVALLLATTYSLMITVSRNGFAAYAVACAAAMLATFAGVGSKIRHAGVVAVLAGASLAVAVPIFKGDFAQQRMAQIDKNFDVRVAHWKASLAMRQDDWLTTLFGVGVGRYPATHYWGAREKYRAAAHGLVAEGDNNFLRIIPGNTLYVEQIVVVIPHQRYRLSFELRSPTANPAAGTALCEKSILSSAQCAAWLSTPQESAAHTWRAVKQEINAAELGSGFWLMRRPVKLSFFTAARGTVDIDNIKLTSPDGQELIQNGDFSSGLDHWYFSSDEHLAWHIKSLPVAVLFDQGWFGLVAWGIFLGIALIGGARNALAGSIAAGITLAAAVSFLVVGIFDTLIDAPRFLFLLVTLAALAGSQRNPNAPAIDPP